MIDLTALAPFTPLLTVIAGVFAAWVIRRSDHRDKEEQRREDLVTKERDRRDEEVRAVEVERKVDTRARELADFQMAQVRIKKLEDDLAHQETLRKLEETHTTAKEAFHEANGAKLLIVESNQHIAETNKAMEKVQVQLGAAINAIPNAVLAAVVPLMPDQHPSERDAGGTFTGTIQGKMDKKE